MNNAINNRNFHKLIILLMTFLFLPTGFAAEIVMFELDTFNTYQLTEAFQDISGIQSLENAVSIDAVPGGEDEWLLLEGDGELIFYELSSFTELFRISEVDFRSILGIAPGEGWCSVFKEKADEPDSILYYDAEYGDWYSINLKTGAIGPFVTYSLTEPFYTGFSYTLNQDSGLLVRNATGNWWYEPLPDRAAIDLDLASLFQGNPLHVSEMELNLNGFAYRALIGIVESSSPGTPTPTPGPGTPTATPTPGQSNYKVALINALGSEDIWRIDAGDYSMESGLASTGVSPSHIVEHQGELYVVNSQSNSITVYDRNTINLKREMSVGTATNPFMMDFIGSDYAYVTLFFTHEVVKMNIYSGDIVATIPMPDDLPADPGETTAPCPEGIVIVDSVAYVACCNLNQSYVAGGPGVIVTIDTSTDEVSGWFESGGRDSIGVFYDQRWSDRIWIANAGDYTVGSGFDRNGTIAIYSPDNGMVTDIIPVNDAPFEITFGSERAYFSSGADGYVGRLSLDSLSLMSSIELPNAGQGLNYVSGMKVGPDGRLWVLEFNHDTLYVMDTNQNDSMIYETTVGDGPDDLVILQ